MNSQKQIPDDIFYFKYASVISVDVKISFSVYKNVLYLSSTEGHSRWKIFNGISLLNIIIQCNNNNIFFRVIISIQ